MQWVDFDQDGALDLSLADNGPRGGHFLFHNLLPPEAAGRALRILVVDEHGHFTKAGSEVRVFAAGRRCASRDKDRRHGQRLLFSPSLPVVGSPKCAGGFGAGR